MTKSKGVGQGRKGIPRAPYSIHDGMKLCKGPLHPEGKLLPATADYFYRRTTGLSEQFLSRCKQCRRAMQNKNPRQAYGYARVKKHYWILLELENRLGRKEASRRSGINSGIWKRMMTGEQIRMEKETLRRIIVQLREARAKDEVRHRKDIRYGTAKRGREERKVKDSHDLYRPHGDHDTSYKRKARAT